MEALAKVNSVWIDDGIGRTGLCWPRYDRRSCVRPAVRSTDRIANRFSRHCRRFGPAEKIRSLDQTILQRIASGEKAAVQECIARYAGLIWSLTRRMALNGADAEDAVQEIFVEIWRNAPRFDPGVASETAFVAMIARRRLIDRRRRMSRRRDRAALEETATPATGGGSVELGEEASIASRAMEELSLEQQRVLRLSLLQGLSHEKIANATGLPLGTVKTHARRGLLRIRELLSRDRVSRPEVNP